jgi:hypothetical protein
MKPELTKFPKCLLYTTQQLMKAMVQLGLLTALTVHASRLANKEEQVEMSDPALTDKEQRVC